MATESKRLVIDASVARAAGDLSAVFPTARNCRDFLQKTLDICHKLVMNDAISKEWRKHQSKFARQWRTKMVSNRKVVFLKPSPTKDLSNTLLPCATTEKQQDAVEKDLHLLEASLATDKRIVSLDDTMRNILSEMVAAHPKVRKKIGEVLWVNPSQDAEIPIQWLEDGAPEDSERKLNARVGGQ